MFGVRTPISLHIIMHYPTNRAMFTGQKHDQFYDE